MKPKIIYIFPKKTSFVAIDVSVLEKEFKVITQTLDWAKPIKLPYNLIRQFFFLLFNTTSARAIYVSSGGYFSLLPTLFGKLFKVRSFIILNGSDCVSFPSYNYGSLRKSILKSFIYNSYKMASKLLPVDASLISQTHTFDEKVIYKKQGIKAHFSNLKTPISVIPNGFDTSFWNLINEPEKRKGFITVAIVNNKDTFKVKGIDLILKLAPFFKEEQFTLVGLSDDFVAQLDEIPKNVKIVSFLEKEDLKKMYNQHSFYLQLSVNEGFGCALSEAMLCGCIPIISNVGALPSLVNNIGFKLLHKNLKEGKAVITKAINLTAEDKKRVSKKARKRIYDSYDISIRKALILKEIEN